MNFLEHIKQIDNIVSLHKEEEYKNTLFHMNETTSGGMNLTNITTMQHGNMTYVGVASGGDVDRYTVFNNETGATIY